MEKLSDMPNISAVLSGKLTEAGISTPGELCSLGSKEAFARLYALDDGCCLSMLCALEGAIEGVRWHRLSQSVKDDLKAYLRELKAVKP